MNPQLRRHAIVLKRYRVYVFAWAFIVERATGVHRGERQILRLARLTRRARDMSSLGDLSTAAGPAAYVRRSSRPIGPHMCQDVA